MPHCELHYSSTLEIDAAEVLAKVEAVINAHDPASHECKGRAYPAAVFHRPHLKVSVSLLTRPHRDDAFTRALMIDLETHIKAMLTQSCFFSLQLTYSPAFYVTNEHEVAGDPLPRYGETGNTGATQ